MKDYFKAHWGKGLLAFGIIFFIYTFKDARHFSADVNKVVKAKKSMISKFITQEGVRAKKRDFFSRDLIANFTKYKKNVTEATWELEYDTFHESEDWSKIVKGKRVAYETIVGQSITFEIPKNSKLKMLHKLNSKDVLIKIDEPDDSGNEADLRGTVKWSVNKDNPRRIDITPTEAIGSPLTFRIRNVVNGDIAYFKIDASSQTQLYYNAPIDSVKVDYVEANLNEANISFAAAECNSLNSKLMKITSYRLYRREASPKQNINNVKYVNLGDLDPKAVWNNNGTNGFPPFTYKDISLKPNHTYQYRVECDIYHVGRPINPEEDEVNVNTGFNDAGKIAISKTISREHGNQVTYKESSTLTIGTDRKFVGPYRVYNSGESSVVEIAVSKWDGSKQWVYGHVTIKDTETIMKFSKTTTKFFPKREIGADNLIAQKFLVRIEGTNKKLKLPLAAGGPKADVGFDLGDRYIYKIVELDEDDSNRDLHDLLVSRDYYDEDSLAKYCTKKVLPAKNIYTINPGPGGEKPEAYTVWTISKDDPYLKVGSKLSYPKTLKIYFFPKSRDKDIKTTIATENARLVKPLTD